MTAISTHRQPSDLTVTDVFCGAGGNTIGAKAAGMRVRVGLNHWERAIETYGTNNPEVDVVERVDVSLCDPRRYPSTDIAIMSPECTTHSPAGGNRHRKVPDLFDPTGPDEATVRSRVTMFDVIRFTEYHRYRIVIVENVVEATKWELFPDWLRMMDHLGYHHRIISANSMFFHPTPQSRDRIYVVFWERGNRAPNLDYTPAAPCASCGDVQAVQAWKNGRSVGKYRRQYVYVCPRCAREVTPYYYAALNALDFSLPAERIGDRSRPLKPRTLERIRFGLEKYGRRPIVVNTRQQTGLAHRVWSYGAPMPAQTCDVSEGICSPFIVNAQHSTGGRHARPLDEALGALVANTRPHLALPGTVISRVSQSRGEAVPVARGTDAIPTQTTAQDLFVASTSALVSPLILSAGSREVVSPGTDPMPTQTASERLGMVVPLRTNGRARGLDEALPAVAAQGQHHMLVEGVQLSMRDANAMRVAGLERELMTQGCGPQQAVISKAPFLVHNYAGGGQATGAADPASAVTTIEKTGVVQPELQVEDCYFRMLQPHEIGAAMAFPGEYQVTGNKRDQVKQYGNAVTPPVMDWIVRQCAATLHPELEEGAA